MYPASKLFRIAGSGEDLVIYDGTFIIEAPLRVGPAQRPAEVVLTGALRYQACTDRLCLATRSLAVRVPVKVLAGLP
jgi:thiol:disulfide interchange protein DsbD